MNITVKRNILFIILPYLVQRKETKGNNTRSVLAFPYGVLSIVTYLKTQVGDKVNIQVLDCNLNYGRDFILVIKEKLNEFKPDVVGLSMMFDNSYKHLKHISAVVREYNNNIVIVLGGSATTASYVSIMKEQEDIDGICFYEGEIPFLRMVNSKNMLDFLENNISWITKKSLSAGRIPQKTLVQNLDDVINIDYSFIDVSGYAMREAFSPFAGKREPGKQFFLVTSRGCPFNCSFCMHSSDSDKSMRYASVDEIIKHLRFLVSKYDMNILTIYDDQLLLNKKRAKQLFKELAQFNFRIECPNGLSTAFMDEELIKLMKNAGMDSVCLAIESGSPYVLNKIVHKPLRLEQVKPVVDYLHRNNIFTEGYFVVGLPGEREEDRDETVRFIKEVGLDWGNFNLATPLRGSELHRICKENGYIDGNFKIGDLGMDDYVIRVPGIDPEYIKRKRYLMNLDTNFVNNHRMKVGDYKMAALCFKDVIARYENHAFAYYYLSKALHALNEDQKAQDAMDKYREILEKDNTWKEYAKYFNIN